MGYSPPTLNELGGDIHQIAADHGWHIPQSFTECDAIARKLCLIHSEVSEALEAVRADDKENFGEELADVIIRVLHLAHGLRIDMDEEVRKKIAANRNRPYMHGGKRF